MVYHSDMTKLILNNQLHIDRRTHNTQCKLIAALQATLDTHQPFERLTVKQLCLDAHVGRATFYRHHQDIEDIITIEYLIALQQLGQALNTLPTPSYAAISGAIVTTINEHPKLPQLATWAHCQDRVIPLEVGFAQNLLTNLAIYPKQRHFMADYLGNCLHQFALQVSTTQPALSKTETYRLFIQLIPNLLQTPVLSTN